MKRKRVIDIRLVTRRSFVELWRAKKLAHKTTSPEPSDIRNDQQRGPAIGNRLAPPRFLLFAGVFTLVAVLASLRLGWRHGGLIGFDAGALIFLLSLVPLLNECNSRQMRRHAVENDANRAVLLGIAGAVMLVVLSVIGLELSQKGNPPPGLIGLIVASLAMSWLFTNTVYGLHYAHMYYQGHVEGDRDCGGIEFPHTPEPHYWDFLYFAFTLGMTFQTSDSAITATRFRRVVTLHSMLGFVFSIGVIAFTINVLGGGGGAVPVAAH